MPNPPSEKSYGTEKRFLGISIFDASPAELVERIEAALRQRQPLRVTFLNPHSICLAHRHRQYAEDLQSFDILGADGIGIIWASRLLGSRLRQRLSADILAALLFPMAVRRRARTYLLGSRPKIAERAARRLVTTHPGLQIVGCHHGYFSPRENETVVAHINKRRPDLLLVGLGAPLQERWILENDQRLGAPVRMTCGGFFDQVARRYPYYPSWAYALRLNWLYRLAHEPGRLWRRYTVEMLEFFWLLWRNPDLAQIPADRQPRSVTPC